jgi:hypothetical protein
MQVARIGKEPKDLLPRRRDPLLGFKGVWHSEMDSRP